MAWIGLIALAIGLIALIGHKGDKDTGKPSGGAY